MKKLLIVLATLLGLAAPAHAQGTLTVAANIQQNANGQPLAGALLYTYVINTVSLAQLTYQDVNLTIPNPWPLVADQNGRLPFFYVASGGIHVRLTDASGNVQFDYANMLVIGGAAGGAGGGGQVVDPTAIAATGDIKFRLGGTTGTVESVAGWVVLNGQTIGNTTSGATSPNGTGPGAQNLYVYLWTNCPDAHCPVSGGRGSSALADFNFPKKLQLPDMRDQMLAGRDCMGVTPCAGGLLLGNITSGGTDNADTPGAFGGVANKAITMTYLPSASLTVSGNTNNGSNYTASPGGGAAIYGGTSGLSFTWGGGSGPSNVPQTPTGISVVVPTVSINGTAALNGGGTLFPLMNPFRLGTWYMKL